MSLKSILFLGTELSLPIRFTDKLPFSEAEKQAMAWLALDTRYYGIEAELGEGGRAIAYKGFVADESGNPLPDSPPVVLKVPNLSPDEYTLGQIEEYLSRQLRESLREWRLTLRRLQGCKYANAIFDITSHLVTYRGELLHLPITVQKYLADADPLDEYLLKTGHRRKKYVNKRLKEYDNWEGMASPDSWMELAQAIAIGLADIHQRRVVHGDIWPPNIFIKVEKGKPLPIFIDFGEAFPIEPQGDPRAQRDHAYRAPERSDSQSIVTQRSDVYSFGKLLLHLAVGEEPILSAKFRGYDRRQVITKKFKGNPRIAEDNPFIIDLICKCVSLDPVDRISMGEVVRALNSYVDQKSFPGPIPKVSERLASLGKTWEDITNELAARNANVGPFLEQLVGQRIDDITDMMRSLSNDVVNLDDTRERLLLALVGLFQRLGKGDRYLSITIPRMWQGSALGLDGRYFSAGELATNRGASIQRTFIFSIQEIGAAWAGDLAEKLDELNHNSPNARAVELADSIRLEMKKYLAAYQKAEVRNLPEELQVEARQRLALVIKAYLDTSIGRCKNQFDLSDRFTSSADCKGFFVGLIPVATLSEMRTLKSAHPVSVFFFSAAEERDQYLLVMTDILGRNSYGGNGESIIDDEASQRSKPHLRSITVFKSVLGVPEDRILKLEQLFKTSINVGSWLASLYSVLQDAAGLVDSSEA